MVEVITAFDRTRKTWPATVKTIPGRTAGGKVDNGALDHG